MKISRKIITLILAMVIIFILTSTTQINTFASSSLNFNNKKIANVAIILFTTDDPDTINLIESLKKLEKNQNKVKFSFYNSQNNIAIQNELLDSVLKSNYDLIILYSANKKENIVEDIIYKVRQKNIPLLLMNIPSELVSKVSKLYDRVAFVTSDSNKVGIAQGKIIVDLWNTNKNVIDRNGDNILQYIILQGPYDDPQAIARTKYSISTINDAGIKIQQLALINGNWSEGLAEGSIDNLFLKYAGSIEAIISNNDSMAIGAIKALQKYGYNKGDKSKNIAVVGSDGLPEAKVLIDTGFMTGTVIQDSDIAAEVYYTVAINLINNLNPTENTNYEIIDGEIIIPFPYDIYTGKQSNP